MQLSEEDKARRLKIFNAFKGAFITAYSPLMEELAGDNKEMQQKVFHDSLDAMMAFATELVQTSYSLEGPVVVEMFKEFCESIRKAMAKGQEVKADVSLVTEDRPGD